MCRKTLTRADDLRISTASGSERGSRERPIDGATLATARGADSSGQVEKAPGHLAAIARFSFAVAAFGLIISLPVSETFWRYLPGLKFVQFPWRFQPLVALACGLLAATVCEVWSTLNPKSRMRTLAILTWAVIINAIFTGLLVRLVEPDITHAKVADLFKPQHAQPVTFEEVESLQNEDSLKFMLYTANRSYFRPTGSDLNFYPPASEPGGLSIVSGRGRVVSQKLNIARREFLIDSEEPVCARIETYHYPHWVARLDGQEIGINAEQGSGLMLVDLPAGAHRLTLDYEVRQASQHIARAISLAAWGTFLIWIILRAIKHLRQKRTLAQ
ncbi:MAG: hypothetical protein L0312_24035, partial [Acidobacteria bacterium]|nr:hypothetical protein [Acidobacteriota bacterium]